MSTELQRLAATAALRDDRLASADPWAVFFSVACRRAIEGKPAEEALNILREAIEDAQFAKLRGEGPPLHEINEARRLWLGIYAMQYGRAA